MPHNLFRYVDLPSNPKEGTPAFAAKELACCFQNDNFWLDVGLLFGMGVIWRIISIFLLLKWSAKHR